MSNPSTDLESITEAIDTLVDSPVDEVEFRGVKIPIYSVSLEDIPVLLQAVTDLLNHVGLTKIADANRQAIEDRFEDIASIMKLISSGVGSVYVIVAKVTRLKEETARKLPVEASAKILMKAWEVNKDFLTRIPAMLGILGDPKESQQQSADT